MIILWWSWQLCDFAKAGENGVYWHVLTEEEEKNQMLSSIIAAPVKTEVAYKLACETDGVNIYIVCFALDEIEYTAAKLKFFNGLGYAIYIAAFEIDEDEEVPKIGEVEARCELDEKAFLPRNRSMSQCSLSEYSVNSEGLDQSDAALDCLLIEEGMGALDLDADIGVKSSQAGDILDTPAPPHIPKSVSFETTPLPKVESASVISGALEVTVPPPAPQTKPTVSTEGQHHHHGSHTNHLAPVWQPLDSFDFPVAEIPVKHTIPVNLTIDDVTNLESLATGSNSDIYLGNFKGQRVVVKMIKENMMNTVIANHEFDVEHGILCRVNHPGVIKLLGAGNNPRRFLVMEHLGGGTLNQILSQNVAKPGLAQRVFHKPNFTYAALLNRALEMAEALDFLHGRCHNGASIVHRGKVQRSLSFET